MNTSMKLKTFIALSIFITVILFACSKEKNATTQKDIQTEEQNFANNANNNNGAIQISGVGFYAETGECVNLNPPAAYAIKMTGDLQGCLYAFIDDYECSPSGTYREEGREYFVGTYNGQPGTFWTTYKFEARYEDCDGGPLGAEIFGRCQHPIVAGSGTGVFAGVTGQLNFKDDIDAGNFPYRGHLRFDE